MNDLFFIFIQVVIINSRKKFEHALEKKKHADKRIDAGREFVEAYVVFLHYVEGIYNAAKSEEGGHHIK